MVGWSKADIERRTIGEAPPNDLGPDPLDVAEVQHEIAHGPTRAMFDRRGEIARCVNRHHFADFSDRTGEVHGRETMSHPFFTMIGMELSAAHGLLDDGLSFDATVASRDELQAGVAAVRRLMSVLQARAAVLACEMRRVSPDPTSDVAAAGAHIGA